MASKKATDFTPVALLVDPIRNDSSFSGDQHFTQSDPEPDFTLQIEMMMQKVQKTAPSETKVKKMTALRNALEKMAKIEKRLIYARLETKIAAIETEEPRPCCFSAAELPKYNDIIFQYKEQSKTKDIERDLIAFQLQAINELPHLENQDQFPSFAAKFVSLTRILCKVEPSYKHDLKLADEIFKKFIDVFHREWIQYARRRRVGDVSLIVIDDFIKRQAKKMSKKM